MSDDDDVRFAFIFGSVTGFAYGVITASIIAGVLHLAMN
jgi:hypothetical protein